MLLNLSFFIGPRLGLADDCHGAFMNKKLHAILKILDRSATIMGSRDLSRQLKMHGIELTERTVRYYLKMLDRRGFTTVFGKEGRRITSKGRGELTSSRVSDRVGFVISRIETLSYLTTLDRETLQGDVILNISFFAKKHLKEALRLLSPVFRSPYVMSDRLVMAHSGESIGSVQVPQGQVGIGTVCSVTVNGIFLKAGIPVASRFGGVLEIAEGKPSRFVSLISYEGSSLDPLEVFIKSGMTAVSDAVRTGSGQVLASFREIPVVCLEEAKKVAKDMAGKGIRGILLMGQPNKPFLEVPVGLDKVGVAVVGGLNPIAVLEEKGIPTMSKAMSSLVEYSSLTRSTELFR
jgi:HTH-type transcriptional regulator, global nitrogen regulator NrpRI